MAARLFERFHQGFQRLATSKPTGSVLDVLSVKGVCGKTLGASDSEDSFASGDDPFNLDEIVHCNKSLLKGKAASQCTGAAASIAPQAPMKEPPLPPPATPPPPPAPAVQPPPAPHVEPRRQRAFKWGPFSLAPIHPGGGERTGWGATCGLHFDNGSSTVCKKNVPYGGVRVARLDDASLVRQLKRWLLRGLTINPALPDAKSQHMGVDVRTVGAQTDPEDLDTPPVSPWPRAR